MALPQPGEGRCSSSPCMVFWGKESKTQCFFLCGNVILPGGFLNWQVSPGGGGKAGWDSPCFWGRSGVKVAFLRCPEAVPLHAVHETLGASSGNWGEHKVWPAS